MPDAHGRMCCVLVDRRLVLMSDLKKLAGVGEARWQATTPTQGECEAFVYAHLSEMLKRVWVRYSGPQLWGVLGGQSGGMVLHYTPPRGGPTVRLCVKSWATNA